MDQPQQTIANEISYEGNGLHSGLPVKMTFKAAPENTGIVFIRTDLPGRPQVKATIENVTNTMRATTLEDGEAKVFTVEHVLAAFIGIGLDNCYVELNSPEPPVGDGSGQVFVDLILKVGLVTQKEERKFHTIEKSHAIYDGDRFIMILPYNGMRVTFTSINKHPLLGTQYADYEITPENFKKEISSARTIGFMQEIEELQKMGLAKGGNLENVLVYDENKCLSVPRFSDELVRHKILDILGDLSLLGNLKGHIIAVKSSHELNARLSREILKEFN